MNAKLLTILLAVVLAACVAQAHKKFYSAPIFEGPERCVCDCPQVRPVLPNKPYYGNAGYHQPPPRPSGGYGNAGSYAVAGSYGAGGGQVSGGY